MYYAFVIVSKQKDTNVLPCQAHQGILVIPTSGGILALESYLEVNKIPPDVGMTIPAWNSPDS
jgi:hypothetical protein